MDVGTRPHPRVAVEAAAADGGERRRCRGVTEEGRAAARAEVTSLARGRLERGRLPASGQEREVLARNEDVGREGGPGGAAALPAVAMVHGQRSTADLVLHATAKASTREHPSPPPMA